MKCMKKSECRNGLVHRIFDIGVWAKGINGALEVIGGVLILAVKKSAITSIILLITQQELIEDPRDAVATLLRSAVEHITTSSKIFGGIYLVVHGVTNVFLVIELLRNKLWSYPAAIAFLCAFIGYQIYRITLHHSLLLTVVTGLDMAIVVLIWHEYIVAKGKQA